jgi:CheY-like chemotaxis protein
MANDSASRPRLLLVEDDRLVRETIVLMLEDDYEVVHDASVGDALLRLGAPGAPPIDVLLLDCLLPDGNVSVVLTVADQRSIPVVLISGDASMIERLDPGRLFLPKPFSQASLLTVLDSARG